MEAMLHVKLLVSKHVRFLSAIKILRIIRRDYRIDSNRRFHRGEANGSTAGQLQVLERPKSLLLFFGNTTPLLGLQMFRKFDGCPSFQGRVGPGIRRWGTRTWGAWRHDHQRRCCIWR
jgi:hypothetical protein